MTPADRKAAHYIINQALNDEIDHTGHAQLSETLTVFLEFRVAQLIAHIKGAGELMLTGPDELTH